MDVAHSEAVEAELNRMIEKRSRNGHQDPDEQHELWKASVEAYHERRRREIAAAWFGFYCRMADNHAALAEDYQRRAEALCEE